MNQKMLGTVMIGAGACLLIGAFLFFAFYEKGANGSANSTKPAVGYSAPDFSLDNLDGDTISLSGFLGKPVVLNFWASWCDPCREEMPLIQQYADSYAAKLVVLTVNSDDTANTIRELTDSIGFTLPVLLDPEYSINEMYWITAYPTSIFIDAEGIIRAKHVGSLSDGLIQSYLEKIGVTP